MNVQKQTKDQKGFTIIEVVLVLAIAGLIFLMVFIALPALQRNQRDTQRKQDMSRIITSLQNYQSNNRGAIPAATNIAWSDFKDDYLLTDGDVFADPSEGDYTFAVNDDNKAPATVGNTIHVHVGATCVGEAVKDAGSRKVAFTLKLENGGNACSTN